MTSDNDYPIVMRSTITLTVDWMPESETHPSEWDWEDLAGSPYVRVDPLHASCPDRNVSDEYGDA